MHAAAERKVAVAEAAISCSFIDFAGLSLPPSSSTRLYLSTGSLRLTVCDLLHFAPTSRPSTVRRMIFSHSTISLDNFISHKLCLLMRQACAFARHLSLIHSVCVCVFKHQPGSDHGPASDALKRRKWSARAQREFYLNNKTINMKRKRCIKKEIESKYLVFVPCSSRLDLSGRVPLYVRFRHSVAHRVHVSSPFYDLYHFVDDANAFCPLLPAHCRCCFLSSAESRTHRDYFIWLVCRRGGLCLPQYTTISDICRNCAVGRCVCVCVESCRVVSVAFATISHVQCVVQGI